MRPKTNVNPIQRSNVMPHEAAANGAICNFSIQLNRNITAVPAVTSDSVVIVRHNSAAKRRNILALRAAVCVDGFDFIAYTYII